MSGWFDIQQMDEGIFMLLEPGHVQSYLVLGNDNAALIDTGMGFADIRQAVASVTGLPVMVLNTHWHFDHIGGNCLFSDIRIAACESDLLVQTVSSDYLRKVYVDPCRSSGVPLPEHFDADAWEIISPAPTASLAGGDTIDLGGRLLNVIETPGHTRGSLSFLDDKTGALFCGDLIYNGTLYAHFTDSDLTVYRASLKALQGVDIRKIFTCHNEPELQPGFTGKCLNAVTAVLEGAAQGRQVDDWGSPAVRYEFGSLAVLAKHADSPGIDLLACMA
ncbi:MAG: MBL fold metallo-hydrolase [Desulfobacterales bacterium]|nr:MBL fold metallo-hydrolase [Desulfobacterales bacterium]